MEIENGTRVICVQGDPRLRGRHAVVGAQWSHWFPGVYLCDVEGFDFKIPVRWDHMMNEARIESDPEYRALFEHRMRGCAYEYRSIFDEE